MGEYAEDALAQRWPEVFGPANNPHRVTVTVPRQHGRFYPTWAFNTETWTTKDGEVLRLEEMTPRHRGNVVRHLQKRLGAQANSAPLVKRMLELGVE